MKVLLINHYILQNICDTRPPTALPSSEPPLLNNARPQAPFRPRPPRAARPVHTQVLDPDSSEEDTQRGQSDSTKNGASSSPCEDSAGATHVRKQLNRGSVLRHGAESAANNAEPNNSRTWTSARTAHEPLKAATTNDLYSSARESSEPRKNRAGKSDFQRQNSRPRHEADAMRLEGESVPSGIGDNPRKVLSTATAQKPSSTSGGRKAQKTKSSMVSKLLLLLLYRISRFGFCLFVCLFVCFG